MSEWKVLPHGEWREVTPDVWAIDGSLPGMPLPRWMIAIRRPEGILIHSAIALDEAHQAWLEEKGPLRWMIVPNAGHRLDAPAYKARYPDIQVFAPRNARKEVEEKVAVDADCEDALGDLGIRLHRPEGMKEGYELVYELDLEGGGKALLVNDILAPSSSKSGLSGFFMKLTGPPGGGFGQPRIVRFFFGKDRTAFRGFVEKLAAIDDIRVLTMSHGEPLTGEVSATLRECLDRL